MWDVYIIETESGKLYTGIAKDCQKRFSEHKSDPKKGAKFFRSDPPKQIVYVEKSPDRSLAQKREFEIKAMNRKDKIKLITSKKVNVI